MLTPRTTLTRRDRWRPSTRRPRAFRCCSAAAAAAARRCCTSCAIGSAGRRRSTSTSNARRRRPSVSCAAIVAASPFPSSEQRPLGARAAFDATLAFFTAPRAGGERAGDVPARRIPRAAHVRELSRTAPRAARLHRRPGRAAATASCSPAATRARTLRLLRDRSARFEVIHVPALTVEDTLDMLGPAAARADAPTPNSRRAPSRRSPTAGRRTCARSPTSCATCASTAALAATTRSARWPR